MKPEEQRLVERGLPLVEIAARRVYRRVGGRVDLEELMAVARAALVELVKSFDPARGSFEGFASVRLPWAMYDALKRSGDRSIRAKARALAASREYAASLADGDGAARHSIEKLPSEEEARHKLAGLLEGHATVMALELTRVRSDIESAVDTSESPEQRVARAEVAEGIRRAIQRLPLRERTLVERHYYGDERFDVIANDLGVSKSWASRLHAQAIAMLARYMRDRLDFAESAKAVG